MPFRVVRENAYVFIKMHARAQSLRDRLQDFLGCTETMLVSLVANRELKTGGKQKGGQEKGYFSSLDKKVLWEKTISANS